MKIQASRRNFMANIVGAAAAAKLMPLMPRAAFGATDAPKRLICVFSPLGYLENSFWPTGEGADFTLGETQKALTPYKDKLLYINGLLHSQFNDGDKRAHRPGVVWDNAHGTGTTGMFTGSMKDLQGVYALSESIDQTVAKHLYAQKATAYKSIALGTGAGDPGPHSSPFFTAPGQPIKSMGVPREAFKTFFDKLELGDPSAGDAGAARRKLQGQSVIDTVRSEVNAVCSRLGTRERQLCDAHLSGLRMLEKRLQDSGGSKPAQCTKPKEPALKDDWWLNIEGNILANMDIIRSAFACDLSRVATLQLGFGDGGIDLEGYENQHGTTHASGDTPSQKVFDDHKKWDRFYAKLWLYLLEQLSSIPEGSGSMLDNTLVVFGSDTTTGQSLALGAHNGFRFPMWMAGGSNFAFRTGRQVMLPLMHHNTPATAANKWGYNHNGGKFLYHNALLVSIAQAFGLDINSYGTHDQGVGGVPGLK